jgi:hypothetical protein
MERSHETKLVGDETDLPAPGTKVPALGTKNVLYGTRMELDFLPRRSAIRRHMPQKSAVELKGGGRTS